MKMEPFGQREVGQRVPLFSHEAPVRKTYKSTFALVHFRVTLDEIITTPLLRVKCAWGGIAVHSSLVILLRLSVRRVPTMFK